MATPENTPANTEAPVRSFLLSEMCGAPVGGAAPGGGAGAAADPGPFASLPQLIAECAKGNAVVITASTSRSIPSPLDDLKAIRALIADPAGNPSPMVQFMPIDRAILERHANSDTPVDDETNVCLWLDEDGIFARSRNLRAEETGLSEAVYGGRLYGTIVVAPCPRLYKE